jgi:pimeloyl-ACP methyl ester carboxylesterase
MGHPEIEEVRVDVSAAVGEPAQLAGWWYEPAEHAERPCTFVCFPGGTYTHGYFDLDVPGHDEYSFARYVTTRGHTVVAFDNLGTGASTRPDTETGIDRQALGAAVAVDAVRARTPSGVPVVGVGHSMGGYVVMLQQAAAGTCDAVAILGTTNGRVAIIDLPDELVAAAAVGPEAREVLVGQVVAAMPDLYMEGARGPLLAAFHQDDVPAAVIEADTAGTVTVVPRLAAAQSTVPSFTIEAAGAITAPVLLAFGERDVTVDPHQEPAAYSSSDDVTLVVLRGSSHCHNMATTRTVLWDRLLSWASAVCG